ncbi:MAG: class II fructose-bisphosphatase [Rhodospirillales bacterium]|nr:MAG: class II fructose-bisphosphatase [Rhodospirillales bacterium]
MPVLTQTARSDPAFAYALRRVTEAAARAAFDWIGRGDKIEADLAGVDAMRRAFDDLPARGVVVIGEGQKDQAPELYKGEELGDPAAALQFDIAVDPVEGTSYLAKGMTNAMAVIAMAPRGTLFDPGPAFYMEKFAGPSEVRGKIDPEAPVADKLAMLGKALGRRVSDLTVYVLEKPRHKELVARIYAAGARVALYPAGDVAGALMAAIPDSGIDALIGTGGTPEGVISACAIRLLGGEFLGRLDPQLPSEIVAVREAGLDTRRWYAADELVRSNEAYFCATGITTGLLFEGVERTRSGERTQTLMISGPGGERQILTTWHPRSTVH